MTMRLWGLVCAFIAFGSSWALAGPNERAIAAFRSGDYETAYTLLEPASRRRDAEAQYYLGRMLVEGLGMEREPAEGIRYWRQSAQAGFALSQVALGDVFSDGKFANQNYGEALKWRQQAADQGQPAAQYALAGMYFGGQGVPQDYVKAHAWANVSAARANQDNETELAGNAMALRDKVAELMSPAQVADAQGLARNWMAATGKSASQSADGDRNAKNDAADSGEASRSGGSTIKAKREDDAARKAREEAQAAKKRRAAQAEDEARKKAAEKRDNSKKAAEPVRKSGNRPSAHAYSYQLWREGNIPAGVVRASTPWGTLVCRGHSNNGWGGPEVRYCRWK
ncbi:MAG: SEL1-like repeat protein [Alphaproteobacteria bacterium]|nr:SEL1-like repeat protein [Alphaproteobacteria bacterium]